MLIYFSAHLEELTTLPPTCRVGAFFYFGAGLAFLAMLGMVGLIRE